MKGRQVYELTHGKITLAETLPHERILPATSVVDAQGGGDLHSYLKQALRPP